MSKSADPSAVVVPFGKHRGRTVAEVIAEDPEYADWVVNQGWVAERFAELHAAILTRGALPDDSPEHNALQARFLDPVFRLAVFKQVGGDRFQGAVDRAMTDAEKRLKYAESGHISEKYRSKEIEDAKAIVQEILDAKAWKLKVSVSFEIRGVDVVLRARLRDTFLETDIKIELKPSLGDDFPTVMRQMSRLGCRVLIVEDYNGKGVSFPVLRSMFEANWCQLLTVRDIEAEMPFARRALGV